jgi:hypothetical protein
VLQSRQKTYIAQGFWAYPGDHARFFQGALHKNWMKLTQMLPHIQLSIPLCIRSAQAATCPHIARYLPFSERTRAVLLVKNVKRIKKEKSIFVFETAI